MTVVESFQLGQRIRACNVCVQNVDLVGIALQDDIPKVKQATASFESVNTCACREKWPKDQLTLFLMLGTLADSGF